MGTSERKQKQFFERHQLILDTARTLLHQEGMPNLSMDKLAEQTEYSKGTIYKHFTCKEDLIVGLCETVIREKEELVDRVLGFEGHLREQLIGLHLSFALYAALHPKECAVLLTAKSDLVKSKASSENIQDLHKLDANLQSKIFSLIEKARHSGDIVSSKASSVEIMAANWSLSYGLMHLSDIDAFNFPLGGEEIERALFNSVNALLDGFGWHPLSTEFDYEKTLEKFKSEIFTDEIKALKSRCC